LLDHVRCFLGSGGPGGRLCAIVQDPPILKFLISAGVLAMSIGLALVYLRFPAGGRHHRALVIGGERPWRRLGAGICLVLGVMFVLGLYILDGKTPPRTFLVYWLIIMAMLLWLCGLALRDIIHTRQVISAWRRGEANLDGSPARGDVDGSSRDA
jgi:hypothetical protein